jgi:hypothetical protein
MISLRSCRRSGVPPANFRLGTIDQRATLDLSSLHDVRHLGLHTPHEAEVVPIRPVCRPIVTSLNRMLELGRPECVRLKSEVDTGG